MAWLRQHGVVDKRRSNKGSATKEEVKQRPLDAETAGGRGDDFLAYLFTRDLIKQRKREKNTQEN
eukprot:12902163-Prorocentrum_lima.AAC.1